MYARLVTTIDLPEDITCKVDGYNVDINGNLGKITQDFTHTRVQIVKNDTQIVLTSLFPRKRDKAVLGAVEAHINNMIKGVTYGFKYSLKIVFSHFPIKVTPQLNQHQVKIENLYGGRKPRYAKVVGNTKVEVDGENVYVSGIDRYAVGQTSANIQELTRQRGKRRQSPKTFMDGIFVFDKKGVIKTE